MSFLNKARSTHFQPISSDQGGRISYLFLWSMKSYLISHEYSFSVMSDLKDTCYNNKGLYNKPE